MAVGTPSHGTATVLAGQGGAPPRISYVPDSGYTGTDSLTYTAEDEGENEDTATVTLTISPPGAPPTAPGGPRGMPTYRLSDGFVVGPYATFTPGASGNYSFTQVTTTTDSDTWTDANNVNHSVDTDTAETLTVTVTQGGGGAWAYSESFTSTVGTCIAPVSGTHGVNEADSTDYEYAFTAAGDADESSYSFSVTTSGSGGGSTAESWSSSETGASGSASGGFKWSGGDCAQITSYSDLENNTSTGTLDASGSADFEASSGTGSYSYPAVSGSVSGSTTTSNSWSESYVYDETGGADSATETTSDSYSGGGDYGYTTDDSSVSGSITESGSRTDTYSLTIVSAYDAGVWAETGSASGESQSSDVYSYSGSGTYSYAAGDGTVDGKITESGHDNWSSGYTWEEELGSGGSWWLTDGSGGESWNTADNWSYSGSGDYTYDTTGGSVTGAITEHGGDAYSSVGGVDSTVVDGDWVDNGSASGGLQSSDVYSYSGSGTYSYAAGDGTVDGKITESGHDNWLSGYTWAEELGTDGKWALTDGEGGEGWDTADNWSYSGSGDYSYDTTGGEVTGTITEHGGDAYSSVGGVDSTVVDGDWVDSGSASGGSQSSDVYSYSGGGDYSYAAGDGTVSGSITESGHDNWSSGYTWEEELGSGGSWWLTDGSGGESWNTADTWSYSGSGDYTYDTTGGEVTGTITEHGGDAYSSVGGVDSTVVDGDWVDSGSASGGSQSSDVYSYSGSGTYSYAAGDGTVDGKINESGHKGLQRNKLNKFTVVV